MRVSVLNPRKMIYEGHAKKVILPGADGEIGILDFHQSFLCPLKAGSLLISRDWKGQPKAISIKKGIAKMADNSLTILVGEEPAE